MTSIKTYKRVDYDRIKREGISYSLPEETLKVIKKISANVGAPEYIKTPHFEKPRTTYKPRVPPKEISDSEWDTLRSFKATTLEKKQGIALSIDKIRKHLNKITDKTYENLKAQIIDELEVIMQEMHDHAELLPELSKIGDAIFEIASGNSFYSKMYATLYKELMAKYGFMQDVFNERNSSEVSIFKDFAYSDPNKDYDTFCKNNKINEKRRALALFYVNLMLQKIVSVDKILNMTEELQTSMLQSIKTANCANIVEEMSEVVYILILNGASMMKTFEDEWSSIINRVSHISSLKIKSEPSISNKTIFKHMDILADLKKK